MYITVPQGVFNQTNIASPKLILINTQGKKIFTHFSVFTLNQITLHGEVVLHVLKTLSLYFKTNIE